MNLVKRLSKHAKHAKHDNSHGHGTALAKRQGGPLGRSDRFGFDKLLHGFHDFDRDLWSNPGSLVRDPWSAFERMGEQLNALSNLSNLSNWPAVDVSEDDNSVTVRCDVPGLDAKDLDVRVSGNLLTVSGSRRDEWSDKKHGLRRQERLSGSFSRTITLPSYVDAEKVEARYDKGTLTVSVPKVPGKGPRRVKVTAA
jgi:HSP20 family protein